MHSSSGPMISGDVLTTLKPGKGSLKSETASHSGSSVALAYGDAMRVLAIAAVVVQHVCHTVAQDDEQVGTRQWWACSLVVAGTKWAVPAFVMLSGALLLDPSRDESPCAFYCKRLARVGIPTVFWSAFYLLLPWIGGTQDHTLGELFGRLVRGTPFYHMFFMFVIIGLYLVTPTVRVFARHASQAEFTLATVAVLALACCGDAVGQWNGYEPSAFTLFVPYLGYYLAGHRLRNVHLSRLGCYAALTAFLICIPTTALGTVAAMRIVGPSERSHYLYTYFSPTVIIMSLSAFLLIGSAFQRPTTDSGRLYRLTSRVSMATFGIYLIHPFFFRLAERLGVEAVMPVLWIRMLTLSGVVLVASWVATELLGRMPRVCRIVGYHLGSTSARRI